jgi:hypothetical protein
MIGHDGPAGYMVLTATGQRSWLRNLLCLGNVDRPSSATAQCMSSRKQKNHRTPPSCEDHWSGMVTTTVPADSDAKIVFQYCGDMDHDLAQALIRRAEHRSIEVADNSVVRKRLFSILVECLENVIRHGDEQGRGSAFAMLLRTGDHYRVLVGNAVPVAIAAVVTTRVEILNDMDTDTLKRQHMAVLSNSARTEGGGAGLGLFTMARKSTRPMRAHVLPKDMYWSYLTLELTVAA